MIEIGIFAAKTLVVLLFVLLIAILIAGLLHKDQLKHNLEIEAYHEQFEFTESHLNELSLSKENLQVYKKEQKKRAKKEDSSKQAKKRVFLLDFEGDIKASAVTALREEVTALLLVAKAGDEVVLRLNSPGGMVHTYGLAASQLERIRARNIKLTVCVDKIGASGGYLMAAVAHQVLTAPFAILGSIGVLAQVPNFSKLLKKWDVDYKEYTAGEYKRTISMFGDITPQGEQKFIEQMETTYSLFKKFLHQYRPQLELDSLATGEYWYGQMALENKLVDRICTSDDYLLELYWEGCKIFQIRYVEKIAWKDRLHQLLKAI